MSRLLRAGIALCLLVLNVQAGVADPRAVVTRMRTPGSFAHRTADLTSVLRTGWVLSGYEAAKRGVLGTHELLFQRRKRVFFGARGAARGAVRYHTEVFGTTKGILPADAGYGKYGVVWMATFAKPSRYVNTILNEVVLPSSTPVEDAMFIVPDEELPTWRARHPHRAFVGESEVPSDLVLPRWSLRGLPARFVRRLGDLLRLRTSPIAGRQAPVFAPPMARPRAASATLTGGRIRPIVDGADLWATVQATLASAERHIAIESRTLRNAEVVALLLDKLRRGVVVQIIAMDPREQFRTKPDNARAIASTLDAMSALRAAGAEIVELPLDALRATTTELRPENHRKLVLVDGTRALLLTSDLTHNTWNFDQGLEVEGPLAARLQKIWDADLHSARSGRFQPAPDDVGAGVSFLGGRALKQRLLSLIRASEHRITIGAYELSDRDVLDALVEQKRARPAIEIKVVLGPHELTSRLLGVRVRRPMNAHAFRALRRAGIEVAWGLPKPAEVDGGIFHAKAAVFDDVHVVVGSTDLSRRSFAGNHELSAVIEDQPEVAGPLAAALVEVHRAGDHRAMHGPLGLLQARLQRLAVDVATTLSRWFG